MKHVSIIATVLGVGTLWLLPACSGEEVEDGGTPIEQPAEVGTGAETAAQTTIHYVCSADCGAEEEASPEEGIPVHCDQPMVPKP